MASVVDAVLMEGRPDKKQELLRLIKFGVVGGMNTAVDFIVFTLLTQLLSMYFVFAQVISYAAGLFNSYFFNSRWTFKQNKSGGGRTIALFVAVNLVALGVSVGIIALLKHFGMQSEVLAKLIAIPFSLLVNFLGNRIFVFK